MSFNILPRDLYGVDNIDEILSSHENCILYKQLRQDLIDTEKLFVSHCILYVIHGKVRVNTYDGDEVNVTDTEMLFMPRDSYLISDYIAHKGKLEVFLLFFDHDIALRFLEEDYGDISIKNTICSLPTNTNVNNYIQNIRQMDFDDVHNSALLEVKLLEFLHLVIDDRFKQTLTASEQGKQKRDIERMMLEHYDKGLSIADFAKLSGRSLSTFNRVFKKKYAMTPRQWLIEKKMHRAKELLDEGLSVTETASNVGYTNVSHFIKAYKSIYTKTPKVMQQERI